jgi:hypothetical protein
MNTVSCSDTCVQVMSHGRHPAEWDRFKTEWIDEMEEAKPYVWAVKDAMMPRRPREVICELLALGAPLNPRAHQHLEGAQRTSLVKRSRKIRSALQSPKAAPIHLAAAQQVGALSEQHADFLSLTLASGYQEAVCFRASLIA